MTRFFAHLCLYLQMIEVPAPPLAIQIILEAYLQVLEVCNWLLIHKILGSDPEQILGCRPKGTDSNVRWCPG